MRTQSRSLSLAKLFSCDCKKQANLHDASHSFLPVRQNRREGGYQQGLAETKNFAAWWAQQVSNL